jgi:hypothetical protein
MDYQPLTIDAEALAKAELHRLEMAYVQSPGPMPRGAFNRMVNLRQQIEPEFPAAEVIKARIAEEIKPEADIVAEAVDPEPKSLLKRVFGA